MNHFNKFERYDNFKWKHLKEATFIGRYGMPELKPVRDVIPHDLVPFHMIGTTASPADHWFHFYIDDYQFERFWNTPTRYLLSMEQYEGGITPDFSILLDMPPAQQIWNCWRNRVLAYCMQQNIEQAIPNVGWSDMASLEWAFDGIPENSVLSVTSQGCMGRDYVCKQSFINGLHELVIQKHPTMIVVYGKFPESWKERFSVPIVSIPAYAALHFRKEA